MPTCRPVNLSTRLTGPRVNIGVHDFMGIPYLLTCQPVNLSTCLPGLTDQEVNIANVRTLGVFRTCPPVDLSTCQPVYLG